MLKMALFDCAINENCCSVDGGRGICPLFFSASFGLTSKNNNLQHLLNYFRLYKKNRLLL